MEPRAVAASPSVIPCPRPSRPVPRACMQSRVAAGLPATSYIRPLTCAKQANKWLFERARPSMAFLPTLVAFVPSSAPAGAEDATLAAMEVRPRWHAGARIHIHTAVLVGQRGGGGGCGAWRRGGWTSSGGVGNPTPTSSKSRGKENKILWAGSRMCGVRRRHPPTHSLTSPVALHNQAF